MILKKMKLLKEIIKLEPHIFSNMFIELLKLAKREFEFLMKFLLRSEPNIPPLAVVC